MLNIGGINMNKVIIDQKLLLILQKNKLITTINNHSNRDQEMIALIKTMITMGYNINDMLSILDNEMSLLNILEFHQELVINKQYECSCLVNKLKKMVKEIKRENNGIYN